MADVADISLSSSNQAAPQSQPSVVSPNALPGANAAPVKPKSNSPWDEELPEEEPKAANIVGTLDSTKAPDNKPSAPLKVPKNIEEKVGQKVPAGQFIKPSPAQSSESKQSAPPQPKAPDIFDVANPKPVSSKPPESPVANKMPASQPLVPPPTPPAPAPATPPQPSAPPPVPAPSKSPTTSSVLPTVQAQDQTQPSPAIPEKKVAKTVKSQGSLGLIKKAVLGIGSLVLLFAILIFLTEFGLLSVGAEKVYGAIGIEKLWGGLPEDSEDALAYSALQTSKHKNFKATGKIYLSIDSTVPSNVTSPLLVSIVETSQRVARDEQLGKGVPAIKTASPSSSPADSYVVPGTISPPPTPSVSPSSSPSPSSTTSDSTESTTASEESSDSDAKEVTADVQLMAGEEGVEADINLKDSSNSLITLVNKEGKLYVKTSGAVDYGEQGKWSVFEISGLKDKFVQGEIFNISTDSGASIRGSRVGNETVGNARCFKYNIESMELGNTLSGLGITSDMVQALSGQVWVGVKDKLIRKVSLKIIPPVSSSVRMVNIDLSFSDYGATNSIADIDESQVAGGQLGSQKLTPDEQRKADIKSILAALKQYKKDNGSYPLSQNLLRLDTPGNAVAQVVVPGYLSALPSDPKEGWYYAYKSDGIKCSISARLENQADPEGQIINNVLLYLAYNND